MNAQAAGGGKSRNLNHIPIVEKQSSFVHWIGCRRLLTAITRYDPRPLIIGEVSNS
jgi:hypothetical protein